MTALTREQRAVLAGLDDVWMYFYEIRADGADVPAARRAAILRGLVRRGLVASRRNDVPGQGGRTEYAITAEGDRALEES